MIAFIFFVRKILENDGVFLVVANVFLHGRLDLLNQVEFIFLSHFVKVDFLQRLL